MATTFHLPDLGEGLPDAEIVAWQVGVGDHVVADQPLLSVETDKAVVEIPSPQAGRIAALHGAPGDRVAVGAPLVEFETAHAVDAGAIVGEVPTTVATAAPAAPVTAVMVATAPAAATVRAAPAVRRRAADCGLDLATIAGSGPDGAVTMADVEAAAAGGPSPRAEALGGVRRAMHQRMTRAGREVVRATVTGEADIHAWPVGTDVTLRLVRAIAAACAASPSLHAWFDAATGTRTLHRRLDLGLAMETDDGLFVPVLRDAGGGGADADDAAGADLRAQLDALKAQVASRTLPREALAGATFTLSNFGMHGGRFAELVVMPPQVAILGAGRAELRCVVVDGAATVRRMLPLSLSFDHRVVTGVEAARFLAAAIDDLRRP